jgi:hypothetical protein
MPLAPMALWEQLTAPEHRARWEGVVSIDDAGRAGQHGLGSVTACTADRLATIEEIVEWRPFVSFARTVKLPPNMRLTARHELEPDGDGTQLRIRWWGAPTAADHARRQMDRLQRLVT